MLKSQKARLDAPEMDSLRLGTGWKVEELGLPQIFVAGTYGEGSPGSVHLEMVADDACAAIRAHGAVCWACGFRAFLWASAPISSPSPSSL